MMDDAPIGSGSPSRWKKTHRHSHSFPKMQGSTFSMNGSDTGSLSATTAEMMSPAGDAAYQAFIRQWWFAQGSPTTRMIEKGGALMDDDVVS